MFGIMLPNAHSTEFKKDCINIIDLRHVPQLQKGEVMGGSMRLGSYKCVLQANSKVREIYGNEFIEERHRHRYEFNSKYLNEFETNGMVATGINPDNNLVEILEVKEHPWFVAVQFHPEYKSTVENPHPLFVSFINAAEKWKVKSNSTAQEA